MSENIKERDAVDILRSKVEEYNQQLQETGNQIEMLQSRREQLKGAVFALQSTVAELSKDKTNNEEKSDV